MKAALRLISGDGELENGWKRLFGIRSGLSSLPVTRVESNPPALRYPGTSFPMNCPSLPNEEAALLPDIFSNEWSLAFVLPANFESPEGPAEYPLRPNVRRIDNDVGCDDRGVLLRAFRHLWQVYEADERIFLSLPRFLTRIDVPEALLLQVHLQGVRLA